jgi:hypothetical protein
MKNRNQKNNETPKDYVERKLNSLISYVDENISYPNNGFICSLLNTSVSLLEGVFPQSDESEKDFDPSDDAPPVRPRAPRSLRNEMAGNLPPVPTSVPIRRPNRDVGELKASGKSGGNPNKFAVIHECSPIDKCEDCGDAYEVHPEDKNMPQINGEHPRILCDNERTRAYIS